MVTKESKNGREIFVILDANSIVHRAFHSFPPTLETSKGIQVNAAYGFTSMFLRVLELFDPKYIVCAFDTAKPTFRHAIYSDYKATRKPTDQSLIDQFPIVEDIVTSFNIPILKREGFEADDIIGTVSEYVNSGKWSESKVHLCIVSSDNDLLQLVSENVSVILPKGNFRNLEEFTRDGVFEKLAVYPEQVVDYKALVGDPSDNIPGVKGIGSKTATELLQTYGDLDNIYRNLNNLKPRIRTLLEEGAEQAGFSKELATISRDVDLSIGLEQCLERDFDTNEVMQKFVDLEFRSLVKKIPESIHAQSEKKNFQEAQFGLFDSAVQEKEADVDIKGLELALEGANEVVVLFFEGDESVLKKDCVLIRCERGERRTEEFLFCGEHLDSVAKAVSRRLSEREGRETLFYNLENFLSKTDVEPKEVMKISDRIYEVKVLSHLESSSRKDASFANLCFEYLSRHIPSPLPLDDCSKYFDFLQEIFEKIKVELKQREIDDALFEKKVDFLSFATQTENILSLVLSSMEKRGILMDEKVLKKLYSDLEKEIHGLEQGVYYDIGHEFNINSTQQLADVLFNELGLDPVKKTKNSAFSTNEEVLKRLEGAHPAISKILEYRRKSKIMNTYIKVYSEEIGNMAIHTDFKQTGTTSGRLSSVNPNMQNLPIGDELSERLREIFVPRPGFLLVSADYSQIDLRMMAHLSQDENLINDFENDKDIHVTTASRILEKSENEISSAERRLGKVINFGIIYGLTAYGLSASLKISVQRAQEYIDEYFENYPGIAEYISRVSKDVQNTGYVETILGRRRHVPGVNSRNVRVKSAAIREAINMPVQGGSADVMKLAIVNIFKLMLENYVDSAFMLLQVHDEIVFEVREDLVDVFEGEVRGLMEDAVNLRVPLSVHISHGANMAELK